MINQVTLVGRLTRDPELRYTSEGTAVATFHLAVNRNFKNQAGEIEADFVSCRVWRKLAENVANYCRKGSLIGITGRIQTRRYEDKSGSWVYVTDVVGDDVRFLDKRKEKNVIFTEGRSERKTDVQLETSK
ncbi:single-stranded DNA-binding protein [Sutcliffiella cohnii]|uniref:single-stranded DNA-binding protein n=1 Tax=Sutcliffiella cohnii TaxID=33932 RepID=UPI002E2358CD|nr:single-stranded DNA-binding protein [Sutcliffiella cohnii]MED4018991.1 single-stranded DNA-binding protein [Sutcliffiella cohnii]